MKILVRIVVLLAALLAGPGFMLASGAASIGGDWTSASRESAGIAPDPAAFRDAIVQVYGARAFNWRGAFALHTWIAVKPKAASTYTTYEVMGWQVRRDGRALRVHEGAPDRFWYGARPRLIAELRGAAAARVIPEIEAAVAAYPYPASYRTWPGPNSNTFTAFVLRHVPEIGADLPPTAIGKDFLAAGGVTSTTPSGGGLQMSLYGLGGMLVSSVEGLEINLLGLSFGIDPGELALRLPGVGKVGLAVERPAGE